MMKYPLFPPIEIGIENCSSDIEEIIEYYWRFYSERFKPHGKLFLKTNYYVIMLANSKYMTWKCQLTFLYNVIVL